MINIKFRIFFVFVYYNETNPSIFRKKHPFVSVSKQTVSILQFHLNKKPIVYNSSNTMAITKPKTSSSNTSSSTLSGLPWFGSTLV